MGPGAPAEPAARFQQHDGAPRIMHGARGRDTSGSGSDNDNIYDWHDGLLVKSR